MIENADVVRVLNSKRDNAVIVSTMTANNARLGLPSVTSNEKLDFPLSGCMSKASSIGLGLALARPERKVMVLDGDGSLLMNLGALVTLSNKAPKNLYHFLFANNIYAITGGQPTPSAEMVDWQGMAEAAGYAATFSFDNLEDLTTGIDQVMASQGPVFVHLAVVPYVENIPLPQRVRPRRNVQTALREMPEALNSE